MSTKGQALITLLFFMAIGITVTTAAVMVTLGTSLSTTSYQEGSQAFTVAESGVENALLRLLRDPSYSGETMAVSDGTATVSVSGANPKVIVSEGRVGSFFRTVRATVSYVNEIFTLTKFEEVL